MITEHFQPQRPERSPRSWKCGAWRYARFVVGPGYGALMSTRWSADRVMALAPDASSRQAAAKLAVPAPWAQAGAAGDVVWGLCAGSGKHSYQVIADVAGPAYKCSCPSRKFPCKHAVALLPNWADGPVPEAAQPPAFAESWIADRAGP